MKHLMILAYGATGTNAIVDHLLNNKTIYNTKLKEPLNLRFQPAVREKRITWKKRLDNCRKKAVKKRLVMHIQPQHLLRLGIKLTDAVQYMQKHFDFILIKRNNLLAQSTSHAYKAIYRKKGDVDKSTKAKLNAGSLIDRFDKKLLVELLLKNLVKDTKHVDLEYEVHIQKDPRIAATMIAKYFGFYEDYVYVRHRDNYHAKKNKWSDTKLCDKLENFSEIEKSLTDTKYEWMLWE